MNTYFYIVGSDLKSSYVAEQHEGNSLLRFHGNNGYVYTPQCYVVRFWYASS
jgi:hypothetical protein